MTKQAFLDFITDTLREAGVWLVLLCLGMWLMPDYGMTVDESLHMLSFKDQITNLTLYWSNPLNPGLSHPKLLYYGQLFHCFCQLIISLFVSAPYVTNWDAYFIKHIITYVTALLGFIAIHKAYRSVFPTANTAIIAGMLFVLTPYYFGHAFFNLKDIPLASLYTVCSVMFALWLARLYSDLQSAAGLKASSRLLLAPSLSAAFMIAVCVNLRLIGLFLYPAWCACLLFVLWNPLRRTLSPTRCAFYYAAWCVATLLGMFTILLMLSPAPYAHPILWLTNTVTVMKHFPYNVCTLTDGRYICSLDITRTYLPLWFYARTPLMMLLFGSYGLAIAAFALCQRATPVAERLLIGMMASQLFGAALWMISDKTPLYDTARHLLYMFPAFAFFAGYGFLKLWLAVKGRKLKYTLAACNVLCALSVVNDMRTLHPYQSTYFNEIVQQEPITPRWHIHEMYTQNVIKALLLQENGNAYLVASGWDYMRSLTMLGKFDTQHRIELEGEEYALCTTNPFYYISQSSPPVAYAQACEVAYVETRVLGSETLNLGTLYKCDAQSFP